MKDRTAILKQLRGYLNELNLKYNKTPLSESQIAILGKRMASYDIYFRKVQEKNKIDPAREPERFLRSLREVDQAMILMVGEALGDYIVIKPTEPQQVPLTVFAPTTQDSNEKLKLSKIRVNKKGVNGHS